MAVRTFPDHLSVVAAAPWPEQRLEELGRKSYYGDEGVELSAAEQRMERCTCLVQLPLCLP